MTRTNQEKKEIIEKVAKIREKHLLTWTKKEWDLEYGYLKDEVLIWDKIKADCKHHWPEVDIDNMMKSYAKFYPRI